MQSITKGLRSRQKITLWISTNLRNTQMFLFIFINTVKNRMKQILNNIRPFCILLQNIFQTQAHYTPPVISNVFPAHSWCTTRRQIYYKTSYRLAYIKFYPKKKKKYWQRVLEARIMGAPSHRETKGEICTCAFWMTSQHHLRDFL